MTEQRRRHLVRPFGRRLGRPLLYAFAALVHVRSLFRMWAAPEGSLLATMLMARPELWSLLRVRFLSAAWSARERFARLADHCETVEALGAPFDLWPNERARLIDLDEVGENCWLALDSPRWLLLDGLLALSLFQGRDRLYSITFILSSQDGGLTAYVGGIQGRRGPAVLDRYRAITKQAHGIRPADLIVELFRMLAMELKADRILCVGDRMRHVHGAIASRSATFVDPVTFDYDALWRERGGQPVARGFYDLPVAPVRKPLEEIPQRKRGERRRRYAMLESIGERLAAALAAPDAVAVRQHEPAGWP